MFLKVYGTERKRVEGKLERMYDSDFKERSVIRDGEDPSASVDYTDRYFTRNYRYLTTCEIRVCYVFIIHTTYFT